MAEAQSGGPFALTWWTADDGGGTTGSGGYALHGTAGQPEPGPGLTGGGFALAGSFWPGGPAAPLAVSDLRAARAGGFVRLDWTAVTRDVESNTLSGATYESIGPPTCLTSRPARPTCPGSTNTYTDLDSNVIGNVLHPTYYLIRAVSNGLASAGSNRVGCFSFGLVPGSP